MEYMPSDLSSILGSFAAATFGLDFRQVDNRQLELEYALCQDESTIMKLSPKMFCSVCCNHTHKKLDGKMPLSTGHVQLLSSEVLWSYPWETFCRVVTRKLMDSLRYLHSDSRNVVHRDIKPENILLDFKDLKDSGSTENQGDKLASRLSSMNALTLYCTSFIERLQAVTSRLQQSMPTVHSDDDGPLEPEEWLLEQQRIFDIIMASMDSSISQRTVAEIKSTKNNGKPIRLLSSAMFGKNNSSVNTSRGNHKTSDTSAYTVHAPTKSSSTNQEIPSYPGSQTADILLLFDDETIDHIATVYGAHEALNLIFQLATSIWENLLDRLITVKLGDFGFACVLSPDNQSSGEGTGPPPLPAELSDRMGTPAYSAPEVLQNLKYGVAIDMWSAGITLYSLLSKGFVPVDCCWRNSTSVGPKKSPCFDTDGLVVGAGVVALPCSSWNLRVSEDAVSFLRSCIIRDPKQRMTAVQAMNHRWLADTPLVFPCDIPKSTRWILGEGTSSCSNSMAM